MLYNFSLWKVGLLISFWFWHSILYARKRKAMQSLFVIN
uniref:Uncharacterized protein n=1 Tax=Anguilla anguilla TaxID=7936 RepID=A0A0E9SUE4_ANGAN